MKKYIQQLCGWLFLVTVLIIGGVCYWQITLPETYKVEKGENLIILDSIAVSQVYDTGGNGVKSVNLSTGDSYKAVLKWCGIFPIKTVSVKVVESSVVTLGGIPFGIKLYTDGVLVVSLSDVDTAVGKSCPAKKCGLNVGDVIVSINGKDVYTNQEVADIVEQCGGKELVLCIRRDGIESTVKLQPEKSKSEGRYKIGLWVRDSSAGIGTVTFYDPKTGVLAGLGHPVCDVDTGEIIPLSAGEIVPARIYSVNKSKAGAPGELRGGFETGSFGSLVSNNAAGVYGIMNNGMVGQTVEVALKQEISEGAAQIYTTIQGVHPDWYTVNITKVNYNDAAITRNMIIEITDQRLLDETGGIVQGMSGSPLLQNGKLIGAVTHVLVDDPTKGYAIFAENMLETAQSVSEQQLKEAS